MTSPRSTRTSTRATSSAPDGLNKVSEDIARLRFNRCVAHVYELSNALQASLAAAKQSGGGVTPAYAAAVREAVEIMVLLFSPMMPHLAEECWAALGHTTLIAEAPWPAVEHALLVGAILHVLYAEADKTLAGVANSAAAAVG